MCTYLKNMEGFKLKDLKSKGFDSIQEMFDRAFKRVNTFEDFRTKLVEGKEKRAGEELIQENTKKQKVDDDKETPELNSQLDDFEEEHQVLGRIVGIKSLLDAVRIIAAHVYVNTALMKLITSGAYSSLGPLELSMDRKNREEFNEETTKSRKRCRDGQDPPLPPPKDSDQSKKKRHDFDVSALKQPPVQKHLFQPKTTISNVVIDEIDEDNDVGTSSDTQNVAKRFFLDMFSHHVGTSSDTKNVAKSLFLDMVPHEEPQGSNHISRFFELPLQETRDIENSLRVEDYQLNDMVRDNTVRVYANQDVNHMEVDSSVRVE
ncbi:hypothetical protein Tco_1316287 [Tanacetum coccineum]